MSSESSQRTVWTGRPSQLTAIRFYLMCTLLAVLLIVAASYAYASDLGISQYLLGGLLLVGLAALIKFFLVRSTTYELTNERLIVESGILSRDSEEIELYRVRDWSVLQPFWLRVASRGHIRVMSNDATAPDLLLQGIVRPSAVKDMLRTHVETARDKKRVRHLDVDGGGED